MTSNLTSPYTHSGDYNLATYCSASSFVAFATILNSLLTSKKAISGLDKRVKSVDPDDVYDFVVIGGGAAGSVVASRLSEVSKWKVLLLENGPDESVGGQVPMLFSTLLGTPLDWNYTTGNETHGCLAMNGSCRISAGKMLGGGTSHNMMVYFRGCPSDFDKWVALGNEGWSYKDVLPYFMKGEDNGEIKRVGRKYHSTGGLLSVERLPYLHPFGSSVLEAADQAGFGVSEDLNGDRISGFSIMQTTSKKGVRRSSAAAYLRPVRNRRNLHISLNSTATKIIVEDGVAVGVRYYKNGKFKRVKVTKEVIISAGGIESPKLLLLSGIGPKNHLESVGVKVVHDLPGVGENFHDQVLYSCQLSINDTSTFDYDWAAAKEYLDHQTGPLSGTGINPIRGRVASKFSTPDSPDIRLGLGAYTTSCAPGQVGALSTSGRRTVTLTVSNLQPQSRGRISLASNDPLAYPVIWGNYLCEDIDVERMIHGIKLGLSLADTKAMRAHDMRISSKPVEACSDHSYGSTKYWTCALRQKATSDIHYGGSCKMGNSSDLMAVVDPKLRVYGLKGLRVADASIMPQVTSSNLAAPTMMVGERAADFIKQYWHRS